MKMKSGRISFLAIVVIASLLFLGGIIAFSRGSDTPETAAIAFMDALARGDVDKLTETSHIDDNSKEELHAKWKECMGYTRHYLFQWAFKTSRHLDENSAVATINMYGIGAAADQDFRIPMVKHEGRWKVDIAVTDRALFPSLPR